MTVIDITNEQHFDQVLKEAGNKLVVVDFFAEWCGPCKRIAPEVHKMAEEMHDIVFVKVDVDKAQDVSTRCQIRAMPTFIYYKNAQEKHRHQGATADMIRQNIAQYK
eukprot:GDKI01024121.1.p2 GENE.GDKI01024121.1~~GDKI01024121.1.p2  ORF type:complete len:107 (-),score=38.96 GDKI01024121.1:26-346(-)